MKSTRQLLKDNLTAIIINAACVGIVVIFSLIQRGNFKEIIRLKDKDISSIHDSVKVFRKVITTQGDTMKVWEKRFHSLDAQILTKQKVRYVEKIKYKQVHASIDSLNDADIDRYFTTGQLPGK